MYLDSILGIVGLSFIARYVTPRDYGLALRIFARSVSLSALLSFSSFYASEGHYDAVPLLTSVWICSNALWFILFSYIDFRKVKKRGSKERTNDNEEL